MNQCLNEAVRKRALPSLKLQFQQWNMEVEFLAGRVNRALK